MIMKLIGLAMIIGGIVLAAYLGIWWCLVGGIIAMIEAAKLTPIDSMGVALGILRVVSTGLVFWLTFGLFVGIGGALFSKN